MPDQTALRRYLTRRRDRRHGHHIEYREADPGPWAACVVCPRGRCTEVVMPVPERYRLSSSARAYLHRTRGIPAYEETS